MRNLGFSTQYSERLPNHGKSGGRNLEEFNFGRGGRPPDIPPFGWCCTIMLGILGVLHTVMGEPDVPFAAYAIAAFGGAVICPALLRQLFHWLIKRSD